MSWWNILRRPPSRPYQFFIVIEAPARLWLLTGAMPTSLVTPWNGPLNTGQLRISWPPGSVPGTKSAACGTVNLAPAARTAGASPQRLKQLSGSLIGLSVTTTKAAPAARQRRASSATSSGLDVAPRMAGVANAALTLSSTPSPRRMNRPRPPIASRPRRNMAGRSCPVTMLMPRPPSRAEKSGSKAAEAERLKSPGGCRFQSHAPKPPVAARAALA